MDECLGPFQMLDRTVPLALKPPQFAQPSIGFGCPGPVTNREQGRARLFKGRAILVLTRTAPRQRQPEEQVGPRFRSSSGHSASAAW